MDLRQLQHFTAVAQEKHFTRAARRLNIVQSALSASISTLELELGVRLFHRTTRQVHLTAAGEALYAKAGQALAAVREARQAVLDVKALNAGNLMIGTVQSLPAFLDLPTLLAEFYERHPGVEIRLRQGSRMDMPTQVLTGQLDMAFIPAMPIAPPLTRRVIVDDEMVMICARSHPLAGRPHVDLSQMTEESFVDFQPGWGTRVLIDEHMAAQGIERHVLFEVNDLATLMALVARGLGIALVPRHNVDHDDRSISAIPIARTSMRWQMIVINRRHPGPAVEAFLGLPSMSEKPVA